MLGKDQATINQLKNVLNNPAAVNKMKNMMNNMGIKQEPVTKTKKIGRNDKCSCGSGKKYKKCCMV